MKYKERKKLKNEEKIKRMVKVSHDLPNNMLHMSKEINDYEYCLPHLLDKVQFYVKNENPPQVYRDHFLQAKKDGRYIIMDN